MEKKPRSKKDFEILITRLEVAQKHVPLDASKQTVELALQWATQKNNTNPTRSILINSIGDYETRSGNRVRISEIGCAFQCDNCKSITCFVVKGYLYQKNLNPVGNVWDVSGRIQSDLIDDDDIIKKL